MSSHRPTGYGVLPGRRAFDARRETRRGVRGGRSAVESPEPATGARCGPTRSPRKKMASLTDEKDHPSATGQAGGGERKPMEGRHMQIGEVADRTGLSLHTICHYEEVGLALPTARSQGGFRLNTDDDVARLLVIKRMKPLDSPLRRCATCWTSWTGSGPAARTNPPAPTSPNASPSTVPWSRNAARRSAPAWPTPSSSPPNCRRNCAGTVRRADAHPAATAGGLHPVPGYGLTVETWKQDKRDPYRTRRAGLRGS